MHKNNLTAKTRVATFAADGDAASALPPIQTIGGFACLRTRGAVPLTHNMKEAVWKDYRARRSATQRLIDRERQQSPLDRVLLTEHRTLRGDVAEVNLCTAGDAQVRRCLILVDRAGRRRRRTRRRRRCGLGKGTRRPYQERHGENSQSHIHSQRAAIAADAHLRRQSAGVIWIAAAGKGGSNSALLRLGIGFDDLGGEKFPTAT